MQLTLEDGGVGDDLPRQNKYVETLSKAEFLAKIKHDHEWKMNGLARHLLAMPKAKRVVWLEQFQEKQGKSLTDDLKSRLLLLHEARKSSRPDASLSLED
jgi:hypothetical protein